MKLTKIPAAATPVNVAALVALAGLGVVVWWLVNKKVPAGSNIVAEAAASVAKTATEAAGSVVAGAVLGVGDVVGLPRTAPTQCELDLAAGRWWDASFSCPAGTFIDAAVKAAKGP
jgi:hypothetical protein